MKSPMIRAAVAALALGALTACSSTPQPTAQMAVAKSTVQRVSAAAPVTAHAPVELQQARDLLAKAERAMADKDYVAARRYAEDAEASAQVAESKAQAAENQSRRQAVKRGLQAVPAR